MATYVVSDIHGDKNRWLEMKERAKFTKHDKIIFIGDIIDRGDGGVEILQEIINTPNMHLILGNHELMMLENWKVQNEPETQGVIEIKENWMYNGGYPTLMAMAALPDAEQEKIITYLTKRTKLKAKTVTPDGRKFYLCHGWLNGDENHDTDIFRVVWDRPPKRFFNPHLENYDFDGTLIIGHTPVENLLLQHEKRDAEASHYRILHAPHFIDIDCGCGHSYDGIRLSCLRLDDMAEFYT